MASASDAPHTEALAGARSLIIGGSSGIGFAVASGAIAAGSHVYIASSSPAKVSTALSRFRTLYPNTKATIAGSAVDLSENETVERAVLALLNEAVLALGGPLDHVVFTAGRPPAGASKLSEISATDLDRPENSTLRLKAPTMLAKFVVKFPGRYLNADSKSSISLTSGIVVKKPFPGMTPFMLSAPGVLGISSSLAIDLAPVRVNVVLPGAIGTELLSNSFSAMIDMLKEKTLLKEIGTPWDCAEAFLFLMRSRFMTGQEIIIDGGSLLVH